MTDVDWCIPSSGSFNISIQFKMSRIDRFVNNSIYHSHSFGFQISHLNSIFSFVLSFQRYTQYMYSFHILIHVLISYTHSCTNLKPTKGGRKLKKAKHCTIPKTLCKNGKEKSFWYGELNSKSESGKKKCQNGEYAK